MNKLYDIFGPNANERIRKQLASINIKMKEEHWCCVCKYCIDISDEYNTCHKCKYGIGFMGLVNANDTCLLWKYKDDEE